MTFAQKKLATKIWLSDVYYFTIGWFIITLSIAFLQFWMLMIANNYVLESAFLSVFITMLTSIKRDINGTPTPDREE